MRDRLIHAYDRVDWKIVWETVTLQLPTLIDFLERRGVSEWAVLLAGEYEAARMVPAIFQDDLLHAAVTVGHRLDTPSRRALSFVQGRIFRPWTACEVSLAGRRPERRHRRH